VEQVQPLVYAPGLSLSAIQTAARSLERIRRGAAPATDGAVDVKNSTGGIREIEFLTQCLQRVHGGSEPWLHSSGTLAALQKLHDKGHIGSAEWHELAECYRLLRAVEHRLQCRHGLQTHRLPAEVGEQEALLRSLGEATLSTPAALAGRMRRAAELCGSVLRLGSHQGVAPAGPVQLSSRGLQKLSAELAAASPALASALSARAPGNLERFLAGAATSEERLAGALANAALIERALPVLAASQLATEILARHPEDLGALFAGEPGCPEPATVEQLRIGSRRLALRTIGRTFVEPLTVFELLAAHTRGMEECVRRALESLAAPAGFAVLAVGRIGTCEADILSDADLLFVRSQGCDPEAAQRCAHELVTALSAYTREGAVLTVDTRIRPHGNAGELVSTIRQLESYFAGEAKGWELLAFSKLRWLAGDGQVAADAVASVGGLRDRCRASREFAAELLGVRRRLEESVPGESFKTGPGGLYDLDFLLGFLEARAGCSSAGRQQPERLASLVEEGLLTAGQGSRLIEIVQLFRRTDHALRVTEGRARHWLPAAEQLRGQVEALVGRPRLEDELRQAMAGTRSIFSAVFND
jgi:glutamate-ammonia-ligase adenylyltransferase